MTSNFLEEKVGLVVSDTFKTNLFKNTYIELRRRKQSKCY